MGRLLVVDLRAHGRALLVGEPVDVLLEVAEVPVGHRPERRVLEDPADALAALEHTDKEQPQAGIVGAPCDHRQRAAQVLGQARVTVSDVAVGVSPMPKPSVAPGGAAVLPADGL